jgi:transposase InsO family protein
MSEKTIKDLVETRKRVVIDVNQGDLSTDAGARILGMSRQGFWKLRSKVNEFGLDSVVGRKRGPKAYTRPHNRCDKWIEETVERLFNLYGVGPDRMVWLLEDCSIAVSRATVYRILVRRRLVTPKSKEKRKPVTLYVKGYPGEEVQIDTTQPMGKSGPTLITAVDDFSRWGMGDAYFGNRSDQSSDFLRRMVTLAPFPISAVRTDNGSEFKKHFITTCSELDIKIIRNPVHHPTSNGKVERMHRTIEEECFWRVHAKPNDLDYAKYWLSRYLAWYNTKRRHGGYGMKGRTPQQKIEDYIINNPSYLMGHDVNETLILYITILHT